MSTILQTMIIKPQSFLLQKGAAYLQGVAGQAYALFTVGLIGKASNASGPAEFRIGDIFDISDISEDLYRHTVQAAEYLSVPVAEILTTGMQGAASEPTSYFTLTTGVEFCKQMGLILFRVPLFAYDIIHAGLNAALEQPVVGPILGIFLIGTFILFLCDPARSFEVLMTATKHLFFNTFHAMGEVLSHSLRLWAVPIRGSLHLIWSVTSSTLAFLWNGFDKLMSHIPLYLELKEFFGFVYSILAAILSFFSGFGTAMSAALQAVVVKLKIAGGYALGVYTFMKNALSFLLFGSDIEASFLQRLKDIGAIYFKGVVWGIPEESRERFAAIARNYEHVLTTNTVQCLQDARPVLNEDLVQGFASSIVKSIQLHEQFAASLDTRKQLGEQLGRFHEGSEQLKELLKGAQAIGSPPKVSLSVFLPEEKLLAAREIADRLCAEKGEFQITPEEEHSFKEVTSTLEELRAHLYVMMQQYPTSTPSPAETARIETPLVVNDVGESSKTAAETPLVVKKESNSSQSSNWSQESEKYLQDQSENTVLELQRVFNTSNLEETSEKVAEHVFLYAQSLREIKQNELHIGDTAMIVPFGAAQINMRIAEYSAFHGGSAATGLTSRALDETVRQMQVKHLQYSSQKLAENHPEVKFPTITETSGGAVELSYPSLSETGSVTTDLVNKTFSMENWTQLAPAFYKGLIEVGKFTKFL